MPLTTYTQPLQSQLQQPWNWTLAAQTLAWWRQTLRNTIPALLARAVSAVSAVPARGQRPNPSPNLQKTNSDLGLAQAGWARLRQRLELEENQVLNGIWIGLLSVEALMVLAVVVHRLAGRFKLGVGARRKGGVGWRVEGRGRGGPLSGLGGSGLEAGVGGVASGGGEFGEGVGDVLSDGMELEKNLPKDGDWRCVGGRESWLSRDL